jgi:hypothetical protein
VHWALYIIIFYNASKLCAYVTYKIIITPHNKYTKISSRSRNLGGGGHLPPCPPLPTPLLRTAKCLWPFLCLLLKSMLIQSRLPIFSIFPSNIWLSGFDCVCLAHCLWGFCPVKLNSIEGSSSAMSAKSITTNSIESCYTQTHTYLHTQHLRLTAMNASRFTRLSYFIIN